ncbi:MAG: hypothetical protein FWF79_05825 [Defluviitaleaceae bacterium]|nr:hypothetical protein [Defluviitaleaceae bacterium]
MGFSGLAVAASGFNVAQRNLNITGHNMANAEVNGFSRQRIVQSTAMVRNVGISTTGRHLVLEMGANWSEVHQIRNNFLDINYRVNVSQLKFYSQKVQTGLVIQDVLGELHGVYSFQNVINNIWYSIQQLTGQPESLATRQAFLATASSFLTKSHEVFNALWEEQRNLDSQIRLMVNEINSTVARISDLNIQISVSEARGDRANDFRDERNLLLDRLAEMIPIETMFSPTGHVYITSMGHSILAGRHQNLMGLRFIDSNTTLVEPVFTQYDGILSAGTPPDEFVSFLNFARPISATAGNTSGQLMGLVQARGMISANHLSAELVQPPLAETVMDFMAFLQQEGADLSDIASFEGYLDAFIADAATDRERAARELMITYLQNDPDRFIIRLATAMDAPDPALVAEIEAEMDRALRAQRYNFRAHVWSLENTMIPQAQKNLDRIINSVVTMINDALTGNLQVYAGRYPAGTIHPDTGEDISGQPRFEYVRTDEDGNPVRPLDMNIPPREGIPLFIRRIDRVDEFGNPFSDFDMSDPLNPVALPPTEENANSINTIFTAGNIMINPAFLEAGGHNNLALSLTGAPGDIDLLIALQEEWMRPDSFYAVSIGNDAPTNVQNAYIRFVGTIATETSDSAGKVTTYTINTTHAHSVRMAVKGVSMDEELNAMLRFQFAFQAASRAFNAIDGMIDRLINATGRVGL